jgi:hypothetical protein
MTARAKRSIQGRRLQQNRDIVAQILRRQIGERQRLRFSLRSMLLCVIFLAYFVWLATLLVPILPRDAPVVFWIAQVCFLTLWLSLVLGSFALGSAWWYVVGGSIGNIVASPITFLALWHQQLAWTFWWMLLVFALFGCLFGGVTCVRKAKYEMGAENLSVAIISFIFLAVTA